MDGPQDLSGRFGKQRTILSLPGIETRFLGRPARSLAIISTELPRLRAIAVSGVV